QRGSSFCRGSEPWALAFAAPDGVACPKAAEGRPRRPGANRPPPPGGGRWCRSDWWMEGSTVTAPGSVSSHRDVIGGFSALVGKAFADQDAADVPLVASWPLTNLTIWIPGPPLTVTRSEGSLTSQVHGPLPPCRGGHRWAYADLGT